MGNLDQFVGTVACLGARISGFILFAPLLGSNAIPVRVKAGLTLVLMMLLYPRYSGSAPRIADSTEWLVILGTELMIGLVMGLSAGIVFEAMQIAGQALGMQMGFSLVNIIDPQTQVDTPVLGVFHQTIAMLIFLQLNVHHALLRTMSRSLDLLPVGARTLGGTFPAEFMSFLGGAWSLGLRIAAPVLAATILLDVALGFISKASPQFPALVVGLSMKTTTGLLVLAGGLVLWPRILEGQFDHAIRWMERSLGLI